MTKKLWSLIALCVVFALVLGVIHNLAEQRGNFHSSALLSIEDYRMIIRSTKYGMILVVMVFSSFFLSEILQNWRIHPVQYVLVGAALSVFYLLLLSLAEHIGFVLAYIVGAGACMALLFWYLHYVLANTSGVYLMMGLLSLAYGSMFILLKMQHYNLLLGSCLIFGALFAVMYCTRHIDWYELGNDDATPSKSKRIVRQSD